MNPVGPFVSLLRRYLRAEFWIDLDRHVEPPDIRSETSDTAADGADIQQVDDGFGPLNHRRYSVVIADAVLSPTKLVDRFRRNPNEFSPTSFAVFLPVPGEEGMRAGDELEVHLPGPWNGPVRVAAADDEHVRLETLDGHMEAGWIEFSAIEASSERTIFRIESTARSGDRFFDALYHVLGVGKLIQSDMWVCVLESAVRVSGGRQIGRARIETVVHHDRFITEGA